MVEKDMYFVERLGFSAYATLAQFASRPLQKKEEIREERKRMSMRFLLRIKCEKRTYGGIRKQGRAVVVETWRAFLGRLECQLLPIRYCHAAVAPSRR